MPELIEQMYCSQQIVIPPKYPYILKRYCKAAIKTQPYDLLRWSFEYFKALAERRAPPVKLRLEYPVYSTEGGLTRGCLKVLANQLAGMKVVPMTVVKKAWQGFCLDPIELRRILCLCEVYLRSECVLFLHFIAVAGGFLTKNLTHTMILLCETLTKEPDGGSAAIPLQDFLAMYKFLAKINASKDYKYINGYREGFQPPEEEAVAEEQSHHEDVSSITASDEFWEDSDCDLQKLAVTDDLVAKTTRISKKTVQPLIGKLERSPSVERDAAIERENFMKDRKERPAIADEPVQKQTSTEETDGDKTKESKDAGDAAEKKDGIEINVFDEDNKPVPLEFYGEKEEVVVEAAPVQSVVTEAVPVQSVKSTITPVKSDMATVLEMSKVIKQIEEEKEDLEKKKITEYVLNCYDMREERREEFEDTIRDIADIVDRYKSANYDLGMVAGRQMSTTSGEFIVQTIEREIMAYIDEQIAVLPDPDLKKKKAKPEEVAMIRGLLEQFLDDNMDTICAEFEEVEEEEEPIPDVVTVYAVPGIGDTVDEEIVHEFLDYALEASKVQADVFMPRNIRHFMCPPLEKYTDYNYEKVQA